MLILLPPFPAENPNFHLHFEEDNGSDFVGPGLGRGLGHGF